MPKFPSTITFTAVASSSQASQKAIRACSLFLVAVAIAIAAAAATSVTEIEEGGWVVIPDVNDAHVQEIGAWAVAEHVKRTNDGLRFGRVSGGEEQLVAGVNYRLRIVAVNLAGQDAMYNALVYEEIVTNKRFLDSFERAK